MSVRSAKQAMVCLTLSLLGIGTISAQDLAERVALLDHADAKKRNAAYHSLLRDLPSKAVPLLAATLPKFGFHGQNFGALILARYPFSRVRGVLRKQLDSGIPFLELTSAASLHGFGDKKVANRVVDKIVGALRRPGVAPWTRATMLRRISKIRIPRVRDEVIGLLVPNMNLSVLSAALTYLAIEKVDAPRTVGRLEKVLGSAKLHVNGRLLSAAYLIWRGHPEHSTVCAKTLATVPKVWWPVWRYLKKTRHLDKAMLAALAQHAEKTADIDSLTNTLRILIPRKHAGLVRTLRKIGSKRDKKVQALAELAYQKLADIPDQLKPKELRGLFTDNPAWLSLFAAETLRRQDDDCGLQTVLELVGRPGPHRPEAIRVLGGYRYDEVVDPLVAALSDPAVEVRSRALTALGTVLANLFPYRRLDLRSTGYKPAAAPKLQQAAVGKIRAWWEERRQH